MPTTIEWLIHQGKIGSIQLLAGAEGIHHVIENVNIMDNPDTMSWLTKGELLLSTGYLFSEDIWLRNNVISQLSKRGCSGIGIVLKRYMDELPPEMIAQANELGFPIIALPYERSMAEISNLIYGQIFQDKMSETEKLVRSYQTIADFIATEHDFSKMLQHIAEFLENPVLLLDSELKVIAYCPATAAQGQATLFSVGNAAFPAYMNERIKNGYQSNKLVLYEEIILTEEKIPLTVFPISDQGQLIGFLSIAEQKKLKAHQYNFVRTIKNMIALELIRYSLDKRISRHFKNDFLKYVLLENNLKNEDIAMQCKLHGFPYTKNRICCVMEIEEYETMPIRKRKVLEEMRNSLWKTILEREKLSCYQVNYDDKLVVFIMFEERESATVLLSLGEGVAKEVAATLLQQNIIGNIGMSKVYKGEDTIKKGFQQALDALSLGVKLCCKKQIYSYFEDSIYHLMHKSMSAYQLKELYNETILPLEKFDEPNHGELVPTLKCFFECGLNLSETAKKLYIHRNTMFQRLEKIKEILGSELKDIKTCTKLQMGIYAKKLIDIEKET